MLKKALVAAALAGLSTAALANPPHRAPAYGYRAHHHYYYRPYVHYRPYVRDYPVAPRPVIVAPAPIVVPPPPAIVFRFRFPL